MTALSMQALENNRRSSREAKRRRRGVCEDCGGETRYNGHGSAYDAERRACGCEGSGGGGAGAVGAEETHE